ncbi:MAG: nucleotide exchange factor GrpE [Chloroflexi bacterium]|nr:nucleotide exchange factor GrpE [Chloroflexota bacterium]
MTDEVVKDEPIEEPKDKTPGEPANQAEAEQPIDLFKDLMEQLKQARAEAAENLDGWQRARAEFANYKRRTDAERIEMNTNAGANVLARVLPIVDDFDRAATTLPVDLKDQPWVNGVLLVHRKLTGLLEQSGVKPIVIAPGDAFDPNLHEAITHEESADIESGHIIGEVTRGYTLGERVLRPAMVRVAK